MGPDNEVIGYSGLTMGYRCVQCANGYSRGDGRGQIKICENYLEATKKCAGCGEVLIEKFRRLKEAKQQAQLRRKAVKREELTAVIREAFAPYAEAHKKFAEVMERAHEVAEMLRKDTRETISVRTSQLKEILEERDHLRAQVTELQTRGTELTLENRTLKARVKELEESQKVPES